MAADDAPDFPPPPIPADVELTDFKFMPLEVARLRRSRAWLICKRKPELAFYLINLWAASWHETPAASMEDDDDVLADAAMCSPEKWGKVRADVMRGWVKCADGRLYHPVVAEKALEAWQSKVLNRWQKECDRIRKENRRRKEDGLPSLGFPPKPGETSEGQPAATPQNSADVPPPVRKPSAGIPPEIALKGQGRDRDREGTREDHQQQPSLGPAPRSARTPAKPADWTAAAHAICDAARIDRGRLANDAPTVTRWLGQYDLDAVILPCLRARASKPGYKPPGTLRWFEQPLADFKGELDRPPTEPAAGASRPERDPDAQWRTRLAAYRSDRDAGRNTMWLPRWGDPPEEPTCQAPSALLIEFGFRKAAAA